MGAAAFLGAAFLGEAEDEDEAEDDFDFAAVVVEVDVDFWGAVSFFAALFFPPAFFEADTSWILVSPELFFTAMTSNPLLRENRIDRHETADHARDH
jgi:hypothetical protein